MSHLRINQERTYYSTLLYERCLSAFVVVVVVVVAVGQFYFSQYFTL